MSQYRVYSIRRRPGVFRSQIIEAFTRVRAVVLDHHDIYLHTSFFTFPTAAVRMGSRAVAAVAPLDLVCMRLLSVSRVHVGMSRKTRTDAYVCRLYVACAYPAFPYRVTVKFHTETIGFTSTFVRQM